MLLYFIFVGIEKIDSIIKIFILEQIHFPHTNLLFLKNELISEENCRSTLKKIENTIKLRPNVDNIFAVK